MRAACIASALAVELGDLVDPQAADARVRLSYSPELVPVDRRVCVSFRDVALGGALSELLRGAGLGQTILVVPRESDIPPELLQLERRRIRSGVVMEPVKRFLVRERK